MLIIWSYVFLGMIIQQFGSITTTYCCYEANCWEIREILNIFGTMSP